MIKEKIEKELVEFRRKFCTQDGRGWIFKNAIVADGAFYFIEKLLNDKLDQAIQAERERADKEMEKINKLCRKYSKVIAMVYDGEDVEKAERIMGLRK